MLKTDACHHNLYAYWKTLAQGSSNMVFDDDRVLFTPTLMSHPLMNPVLRFSLFNCSPQSMLENVLPKTAQPINVSWWHDSNRHDGVTLDILNKHFKLQLGPVPVMQFDLIKTIPEQHQYHVNQWASPQQLADFCVPINICFELDTEDAKIYQRALEHQQQYFRHFYVKRDEKIIGVGSIFIHEDTVGFYNLAVLPVYRHQGVATAIHLARLRIVKDLGFKQVTLQATPMAIHLDQALGFEPVSYLNIFW